MEEIDKLIEKAEKRLGEDCKNSAWRAAAINTESCAHSLLAIAKLLKIKQNNKKR